MSGMLILEVAFPHKGSFGKLMSNKMVCELETAVHAPCPRTIRQHQCSKSKEPLLNDLPPRTSSDRTLFAIKITDFQKQQCFLNQHIKVTLNHKFCHTMNTNVIMMKTV